MKIQHPNQEDLTLYYYQEHENADQIARHLETCGLCAENLSALTRLLSRVGAGSPPPRGADYALKVWTRLQPDLKTARSWSLFGKQPSWLQSSAGLALLFLVVFLGGRALGPKLKSEPLLAEPGQAMFLQVFQEHLDKLQLFWLETGSGEAPAQQASSARELANQSRLYRQVAMQQGQDSMVTFLDDLEIIMLEMANTGELESQRDDLARQMQEREQMLLKIQILRSQLTPPQPPKPPLTDI